MPKAAKIAGILIKLPPNMAKAGWDIDEDILRQFCKAMGITWNISIRFTSGQQTLASHCCKYRDGKWAHYITLSQVLSFENALRGILHELCHAMQNERCNDPWEFDRQYRRFAKSGMHYLETNPFEIECETFADNNADEWHELIY